MLHLVLSFIYFYLPLSSLIYLLKNYMFTVAFTPIAPSIAVAIATTILSTFFHFSLFILLIFYFFKRLMDKGMPVTAVCYFYVLS